MFSRDHRPTEANWQQEEPVDEVKPFDIPKREVWEAFKKAKANQGAAGVDGQSIADRASASAALKQKSRLAVERAKIAHLSRP